jgi:hypothetical protein
VAEAQRLQAALGRIRRASGDYAGKLLAIDPHRVPSYSKRQMRRYRDDQKTRPYKVAPTFFALDPDTHQPLCFTTATSARTATTAAIELLQCESSGIGSLARPTVNGMPRIWPRRCWRVWKATSVFARIRSS